MTGRRSHNFKYPFKPVTFEGPNSYIKNREKFEAGKKYIKESITDGSSFFSCDDMIIWNRNVSIFDDPGVIEKLKNKAYEKDQAKRIYRSYILRGFAYNSIKIPGCFIEAGCYKGDSVEELLNDPDISAAKKNFYLFDLFDHTIGDAHVRKEGHIKNLHSNVVERFKNNETVKVIKGRIPDVLEEEIKEKVAFAHIDLNNSEAESKALEFLLPRMSLGGCIVFDDYGWQIFRDQKVEIDQIIQKHGYRIIEIPTGQGIVIVN
ncbi:MAG: class I SAM-dependent methyltransferase [Alphaproteobacteria bacterium]|nr:class I SAM-dependent methyltransferase [Alphaproteobacteria bacterium]